MIGIKARYALTFVPFAVSNAEGNRDDMLVRGSVKDTITDDYDLVQTGKGDHYFVMEVSSLDRESFASFVTRFRGNSITYEESQYGLMVTTILNGDTTPTTLNAHYGHHFKVNDVNVNMNYMRYESLYHPEFKIDRKADVIEYAFNGKRLSLNYQTLQRTVQN
jgi:hypothetical protein